MLEVSVWRSNQGADDQAENRRLAETGVYHLPSRWNYRGRSQRQIRCPSCCKCGMAAHASSKTRRGIPFDDSFGNGVARQASDIMDVQLVHQALAMFFDGFYAESQFRRDLF